MTTGFIQNRPPIDIKPWRTNSADSIYSGKYGSYPIAYWKLDETSGTTAYNGNQYFNPTALQNLTFVGSPSWNISGILNGCVYLPGDGSSYLSGGNSGRWVADTLAFTFTAWIFLPTGYTPSSYADMIYSKHTYNEATNRLSLGINSGGGISSMVGNTLQDDTTNKIPIGRWIFVWQTRDGSGLVKTGWVPVGNKWDYTAYNTFTDANSAGNNAATWKVGKLASQPGTRTSFLGSIDNVVWIKGTALSSDELNTLYQEGIRTKWDITPKRLVSWDFNEGSGTVAQDRWGTTDLTGTGTPTWINPGKVGTYATQLDGISQYWSAPDNAIFKPLTGEWSWAGWVYVISNKNNYDTIWCKSNINAAEDLTMFLGINAFSFTVYLKYFDGGVINLPSLNNFPHGEWVFLWARRISNRINFGWSRATDGTFDPSPKVSANSSASMGNTTSVFRLGSFSPTPGNYGNMKFDQVVWCNSYGLSDLELEQLYNQGLGTESYNGFINTSNITNGKLPAPTTDVTLYNIENQVFSISNQGIQRETGGIKCGWLYGVDATTAHTFDNIAYIKYTCTQDCIATHMAARMYTGVTTSLIRMGIYTNQEFNNATYPAIPYKKIGETVEYSYKGVDTDRVILVPLTNPVALKAGQKYWLAYFPGISTNNIFYINRSAATHAVYYALAYSNGLPNTVTTAPTGATTDFALAVF